jgi:RNA polymerase sigma factor (sigma-70 family)
MSMSEGVAGMGNAALFAAARTGDEGAWPELVRRYDGLIRAVVSQFSMNSADSGDAAQNTWLRLFERAATVREPEKLGAWLATTARRECLAIVQRRVEYPKATEDLDRPSPDPTPEAAVIAAEMRVHVRAATDALPGRPRALIDALYYRPRSSYAEVGDLTGMPIGSIGPTRIRALRHLRRTLVDWAA